MENLENNITMERIRKVTFVFILFLFFIGLIVSIYYNYTLQKQVNERDILIENLTQKDSILNKIMDLKYDSVTGSFSYSYMVKSGKVIKYNNLVEELDKSKNDYNIIVDKNNQIIKENTQNINDYNSLSNSFNSLNNAHNDLIDKYNILVSSYNKKIKDNNELISNFNKVADSLSSFKTIVKLVQSNYDIKYRITRNGNMKETSIKGEKLDSALILLPYFRDRLRLDKEKKVWIINTTMKGNK